MKAKVFFADEKIRDTFADLKGSRRSEDQNLSILLDRAFDALSRDAFCGVQIPKKQIPEIYRRHNPSLRNLWKYNLTDSWRLIYTVASDGETIVVIIEWLDHTTYERRFGY
jgi:mRNA-degrading endonuclease RelE of RelBE toxin-antitoxin system